MKPIMTCEDRCLVQGIGWQVMREKGSNLSGKGSAQVGAPCCQCVRQRNTRREKRDGMEEQMWSDKDGVSRRGVRCVSASNMWFSFLFVCNMKVTLVSPGQRQQMDHFITDSWDRWQHKAQCYQLSHTGNATKSEDLVLKLIKLQIYRHLPKLVANTLKLYHHDKNEFKFFFQKLKDRI